MHVSGKFPPTFFLLRALRGNTRKRCLSSFPARNCCVNLCLFMKPMTRSDASERGDGRACLRGSAVWAPPPPGQPSKQSLGVGPAWGEQAVGYGDEHFPVEATTEAPSPKSALCFPCAFTSVKPGLGTQGSLDESLKCCLY